MAGNPLIENMTKQNGDNRFGQFGAGGAYSGQHNGQNAQQYIDYSNPRAQQPYSHGGFGQNPYASPSAQDLNQMYQAPSAGPAQTGQLTINDVIVKTGLNLAVLLVGAAISWFITPLVFVGFVAALVLGLVNSFKKKVSPALVVAYSFSEGLLLGGISSMFEAMYPGIVVQAVLGTLIVFATILVLYRSGKVRASAKATKIFMVAAISYMIFCLINLGAMLFMDTNMRSIEIMGIPLGLIIGLLAIVMASYSLVLDFTHIGEAVRFGAPERESWRLAFGLIVTLVWLYIEILRVLSYIRSMADN